MQKRRGKIKGKTKLNRLETSEKPTGAAIIDCLRTILKRCKEAGMRLDYPGEGGERPFRHWLATDLLEKVLKWPTEKVIVGERFDILIQDGDNFPIVTIETKTPYHKATKKEREDFEKRLSGYGTLRTAYFTNGREWERLDIFAPTGEMVIRDQFALNIEATQPEEVEAFFTPLFADRYLRGAPRISRHAVTREQPHILEALAADLDQVIGDLTYYLRTLFTGLREGRAGVDPRRVTLGLFDLWCEKSLIVTLEKVAEELIKLFKAQVYTQRDITNVLTDMGLTGGKATKVVEDLMSLSKAKQQDINTVIDTLWPAYEQTVDNLCAQTAHVALARALLYRVGEDQNIFPRLLSGEHLEGAIVSHPSMVLEAQLPCTDLLSRVRLSMQGFLPAVYQLGEFDWWLVTSEKRAILKNTEYIWLREKDTEHEHINQRFLRMLNGYYFGRVDVDVWRNVYQHYLPPEMRQ
jgi:hypothetical protein